MENSIDPNVDIVMRQTNYSIEEAVSLLQLYNNDVAKVIRSYLIGDKPIANTSTTKPLSFNQQMLQQKIFLNC